MNIETICRMTTRPEVLNALHACRHNHPLNNPFQWRNAYALASQQPSYVIDCAATCWLEKQAKQEAAGYDLP